MEIRQHGKHWMVWNTSAGYAEHVGTREECEEYIRNVRDLFGGR